MNADEPSLSAWPGPGLLTEEDPHWDCEMDVCHTPSGIPLSRATAQGAKMRQTAETFPQGVPTDVSSDQLANEKQEGDGSRAGLRGLRF